MEAENSSGVTGITTTTMDNEGDRFSELTDDLLHRILSLLDIKQVVQSSILSSRWRYLWISMPSLNISQQVFRSCKTVSSNSYRFVKFVDMVLQSKTSIEKFLLSCYSDYFVGNEQVYKWIVDAVRLKVSVLELRIGYCSLKKYLIRPLTLPLCLFTCNTLTTLKLDLGLFKNTLVLSLPDSVGLTALKTLHLSSLDLIGEESTDSFFSRCPVLETLIIYNCRFKEAYKNNYLPSSIFCCSTLVSLMLEDPWTDFPMFNNIPDDSVNLPSLKFLHLECLHLFSRESTGKVFFSSCPSLESLILSDCKLHVNSDILPRYVFTCKTLVKLDLDGDGWSQKTIFHIPDLVSLPCLKVFHLNRLRFLGEGIAEENILSCPVLETLIISHCSFTITDNFFLGCPVLETMIVSDCSFTNSRFFCKSLTKLVLKTQTGSTTAPRISLPDSMSLPALKTLHLESYFLDKKNLITDLLASCPDLESLTIMKCEFRRVNLNISSHKLRHLSLVKNKSRVFPYALKDYEVKLNAPNLTSFICEDYISKACTIENLSSLVKVDINFKMETKQEMEARSTYAQQMMKILGVLYNVTDLTLSAWFLEVVSGALDLPDSPTIQFCNLRCLKLRAWPTMNCACVVMYLLEHSPNIESLSLRFPMRFPKTLLSSSFFEKDPAVNDYREEMFSLQCMLHHLKSVELQSFTARYPEFNIVEFLLKNAMNLQKLMIRFATMIENPKDYAEKVLSLPRASASVAILFMS